MLQQLQCSEAVEAGRCPPYHARWGPGSSGWPDPCGASLSGPDHHGMGWCWTQKQAFQSWAASAWRRAYHLVNVVIWALLAMWMGHGVEASCSALSEPCRHTPRCTLKKLLWSLIVSVHPLRLVFRSCELGSCYNLGESRCVPGSVSRGQPTWSGRNGVMQRAENLLTCNNIMLILWVFSVLCEYAFWYHDLKVSGKAQQQIPTSTLCLAFLLVEGTVNRAGRCWKWGACLCSGAALLLPCIRAKCHSALELGKKEAGLTLETWRTCSKTRPTALLFGFF